MQLYEGQKMYKTHLACEPPGPREGLWRYMNLAKFIDLLETQELYFTQLSRMEDAYEGALSGHTIEMMREYFRSDGIVDRSIADKLAEETYTLNQYFSYVNCWHRSAHESMAMWKQYGDDGIAIKTNFERFRDSLSEEPRNVNIGKVKYGNYATLAMNFGNTISPAFHKRRVFDFEKEVRAFLMVLPENAGSTMDELLSLSRLQPPGVRIEVKVQTLVQAVYVSPGKPAWYRQMIERLLYRYEYHLPLQNSTIDKRPMFH